MYFFDYALVNFNILNMHKLKYFEIALLKISFAIGKPKKSFFGFLISILVNGGLASYLNMNDAKNLKIEILNF